MGNMPVKVLNLGEKRYVEPFSADRKPHLLRDMIDKMTSVVA